MDWLRNNSFISVNRQSRNILNTNEECDPGACYDSFKEHWLQTFKIIQRSQQLPSQDDVLSVVNHLEQMVTLLVYDVKKADMVANRNINDSKCLSYLLDSRILEQLFEWGIRTGKYANAVCLEQLKFYEMLVCHVRQLLLAHEAFLRPMLKLLSSCQSNVFPKDVEKCLVSLLSQICVLLTQNSDMLELFFTTEQGHSKFIIFDLLVTFLHREDYSGMQARDALLLCMSLTKKNDQITTYISEQVNICVLLATGLSGLYTILPNVLNDIVSPDWHRLTPDDVKDIKNLCTFITSLEFSNAVAQVSHPSIQKQMQEFLHRGFLIPVLGPALLQTDPAEQIAATAYLELILRTVTSPGLLYSLLQFLLQVPYDGQKMLDILIKRINSENQIGLVTISLFETIVDLNCEDLMLELVFQHLLPSLHLILSHRQKMLLDPHCHSFEKFLALAPNCINIEQLPRMDEKPIYWNYFGGHQTLYGNYHAYLCDARSKITSCQIGCSNWSNSYNGYEVPFSETIFSEDNVNSLPSLGESSGYESLKAKLDENIDETSCDLPVWQISQSNLNNQIKQQSMSITLTNDSENLSPTCGAGPFLTAVLEKLKCFLSNSLYINLHLTGLISRLAVYSQLLLKSYLLDHSLVLQPNIPSLFQIIGNLKLQIDEFMSLQPDSTSLIRQAKEFLLERETRLINARRNAVERNIPSSPSTVEVEEPFRRNGSKRRSFTSSFSSISNMFGRRPSQIDSNIPLITTGESIVNYQTGKFTQAQHVALCAVLLDEWVKELAALAQEHTIAQLAALLK